MQYSAPPVIDTCHTLDKRWDDSGDSRQNIRAANYLPLETAADEDSPYSFLLHSALRRYRHHHYRQGEIQNWKHTVARLDHG
jgi:hypothetical protein